MGAFQYMRDEDENIEAYDRLHFVAAYDHNAHPLADLDPHRITLLTSA